MEDILEEERSYFLRTDTDGDQKLDKQEFVKHFLDSIAPSCLYVCICDPLRMCVLDLCEHA